MADEADNDDQWLYGDFPEFRPPEEGKPDEAPDEEIEKVALHDEGNPDSEKPSTPPPPTGMVEEDSEMDSGEVKQNDIDNDEPAPPGAEDDAEDEKQNGENSEKDESDEDDSDDDDVNVVIGDIKTSPAYTSMNIKRGGLINTNVGDKNKVNQQQSGKFTVDEFDQMGMINGVPAGEFNMDSMDDKPWRKPGADITDYFNYGFNEDTWKAYCERQKRIRVNESGVGLIPLNAIGLPRGPIPIMNDNSKYSGTFSGIRKAGPPPGRRMTGAIDVIGGSAQVAPGVGGGGKMDAPKENVIQVMTADRREYSRKPPGFPDLSMPPPQSFEEFQPEFGFNPEPEPFYGGYEPTQDVQWAPNANAWAPGDIKPLTPGPGTVAPASSSPVVGPPMVMPPGAPVPPIAPPPQMVPPVMPARTLTPPARDSPPVPVRSRESMSKEREREREGSTTRRVEKSRDRERSHRRERSRSRSRRHKSRSRSPSHRHRKKKSRRHEDSD